MAGKISNIENSKALKGQNIEELHNGRQSACDRKVEKANA
jgi:hypothetical protein